MTGIIASMLGATFAPAVVNNAVSFDGTGDYYTSATDFTGSGTDSPDLIIACTFFFASNGNSVNDNLFVCKLGTASSDGNRGWSVILQSGRVRFVRHRPDSTNSEVMYLNYQGFTQNAWNHFLIYIKPNASNDATTSRAWINGVDRSSSWQTGSAIGGYPLTGSQLTNWGAPSGATVRVGAYLSGSGMDTFTGDFEGRIAQFWATGGTLNAPSIDSFYNRVAAVPKDLGTNGTGTGLSQPYIYHYGNTSTFVNNNGTGFASYTLTATGNIADAGGASYTTARTAKTLTAYGNAQIDTAQSVFGSSSLLLDGNGDYVQTAASTDFELGSGDFTIEFRIRFAAVDTLYVPICQRASTGIANGEWWCEVTAAEDEMYWGFKNTAGTQYYVNLGLAGTAFAINTWYHIAVVRRGNSLQLYQNGTAVGSATTVTGSFGVNAAVTLGALGNASYSLNGWLDEIRISSIARYTANFTPSGSAFTNDASTLLLVHADGDDNSTTFKDDNDSGPGRSRKVITAVGNAQISTAQSVFGGASALFDGTGDRLSILSSTDFNLGTSITTWTIEGQIYLSSLPSSYKGIISCQASGTTNGWGVYIDNNNRLTYISGAAGTTHNSTSGAFIASSWAHWAVVRNGTTLKMYVNGTETFSTTSFISRTDTASPLLVGTAYNIAGSYSGLLDLAGYLDEIRISNVARYTANFTAPAAAFTNDANTLLLIHADGTNGSTTFVDDNA